MIRFFYFHLIYYSKKRFFFLFSHNLHKFTNLLFCIQFYYKIESSNSGSDLIPLHAGSRVMVSKTDLIKIFDPKPSVYTGNLALLLFDQRMKQKPKTIHDDVLYHFDERKLKSLIS